MVALATFQYTANLLNQLRDKKLTLGTVESCTGGLMAGAITHIPGASDVFMGSIVAYANRVKNEVVSVPEATLNAHGAVSEETARAMAEGGRQRLGVDICVSITGIAGPDGGTLEKPVGLVHIAAAGPKGLAHRRCVFSGDREEIRHASVDAGLRMIADVIL